MNSSAAGLIPLARRATPAILVQEVFPSFPIESWNADNSPSLPNVKQFTFARVFQEASMATALSLFSSAFSLRLRAPSHFCTILKGGSFRTIDPVTKPHRPLVTDGSLLRLSRASRGGAISRRRYPSARLRHFCRRFRHAPSFWNRISSSADSTGTSAGKSLSISGAHRSKTRHRRAADGVSVTAPPKAKPEASTASKHDDQPLSAAATASAGGAPGLLPCPTAPRPPNLRRRDLSNLGVPPLYE